MTLAQDLQTRTDAELAEMAKTVAQPSEAAVYIFEEIEFRERHPEYRVA